VLRWRSHLGKRSRSQPIWPETKTRPPSQLNTPTSGFEGLCQMTSTNDLRQTIDDLRRALLCEFSVLNNRNSSYVYLSVCVVGVSISARRLCLRLISGKTLTTTDINPHILNNNNSIASIDNIWPLNKNLSGYFVF
jgi:hypothetical protein